MRSAFFQTLFKLAKQDKRIQLIVADIGFGAVESFAESYPNQFLNVGVAEQNMIGIATGMALSGKSVFAYSIANFPTLRCLEQIRNDVCYHSANVKIVAVGGGFSYGSLGMSHHLTEDFAIMRALPNMMVLAPGDPIEVQKALHQLMAHPGPCYIRLGRAGEPAIHSADLLFELGKAITVTRGGDLTLISTGALLETTVKVAQELREYGCHARVMSMHTIKPLDTEAVLAAARETPIIITIEEHSVLGGLGGAVAEVLAEGSERKVLFKRIGLPSIFSSAVGDQEYLRAAYGLSKENILKTVKSILSGVEANEA